MNLHGDCNMDVAYGVHATGLLLSKATHRMQLAPSHLRHCHLCRRPNAMQQHIYFRQSTSWALQPRLQERRRLLQATISPSGMAHVASNLCSGP